MLLWEGKIFSLHETRTSFLVLLRYMGIRLLHVASGNTFLHDGLLIGFGG